jgi:hypothetical protein
MRSRLLLTVAIAMMGCGGQVMDEVATEDAPLTGAQTLGREVWLKATFGGQAFFSLIAPKTLGLHLGFDAVLTTPRAQRFAQWGVLNEPGCTDGDASTGFLDKCPPEPDTDPTLAPLIGQPSGVVGVRKFVNPLFDRSQPPSADNSPFIVGVSCAGCHAGWNPANPPADTANPTWDNIHETAGNQYIQIGKIFGAHLPESDPKWQVFHTWRPGTVDTTAIESDHINNPGIITQFWNVPSRPFFDLHYAQFGDLVPAATSPNIHVHRGGQGGEDDVGCQMAALRVYFNIGMCAAECMLPHLTNGPGGTQTPIDFAACSASCPAFNAAKQLVIPISRCATS